MVTWWCAVRRKTERVFHLRGRPPSGGLLFWLFGVVGEADGGAETVEIHHAEASDFAGAHALDFEVADAHAFEFESGVADGFGHEADLAFAALVDDEV